MTDKTPEQIEIETLRAHNAELLADLKAAKASGKTLAAQVESLTAERDQAAAQVQALTIGQPVQAMAERIATLPDLFIAEFERRGWHFEHTDAGLVIRDAEGNPAMLQDSEKDEPREARFTEADVRALCLEEWKPASDRHPSRQRFAHLIKADDIRGCGAMQSQGSRFNQLPATPATQAEPAPQYGLR